MDEQPKYFVSGRFKELEGKLKVAHVCTEADAAKMNEPVTINLLVEKAHTIASRPDHEFQTEDGRRFGLYLDGASIVRRVVERGGIENELDKAGLAKLKRKVVGIIMEVDPEYPVPPVIFKDMRHVAQAWRDHHDIFGVEPSPDSEHFLNTYLED